MEVEIKYRLGEQQKVYIESQLKKLGSKLIKKDMEKDIYFNVAGRNSIKTKECLRIRKSEGRVEMTYKPGSKKKDTKIFAKQETNLHVASVEEAVLFLELLGNTRLVEVNKHRKYFKLKKCFVVIDSIDGVGDFLEIESDAKTRKVGEKNIHACLKVLNISNLEVENRPYRDIVIAYNKKRKPSVTVR